MKTLLLVLLNLLLLTGSKNVGGQIPNGDFENWHFGGWFMNPDFWWTNNSQLSSTEVAEDSMAYHGSIAMRLKNNYIARPIAQTKFPIVVHPLSFTGYVKCTLAADDTVQIKIILFNNGIAMDSGIWNCTTSISNYTQLTIPISNSSTVIDTATITIEGGNHTDSNYVGTTLLVDFVSFDFSTDLENLTTNALKIFPNPASNKITISLPGNKPSIISILNMLGEEIFKKRINNASEEIDVSQFPKGMYLVHIANENQNAYTNKIVFVD